MAENPQRSFDVVVVAVVASRATVSGYEAQVLPKPVVLVLVMYRKPVLGMVLLKTCTEIFFYNFFCTS